MVPPPVPVLAEELVVPPPAPTVAGPLLLEELAVSSLGEQPAKHKSATHARFMFASVVP
jgi:hypothetical protein